MAVEDLEGREGWEEGPAGQDAGSAGSGVCIWHGAGLLKMRKGGLGMLVALALAYSFFLYFKPSEPYLTSYLEQKGFSEEQVYQTIFPWWTYAFLAWLLVLGAAAEFVGYRACMLAGAAALLASAGLLLAPGQYSAEDPAWMGLAFADQVLDGLGSASAVVYSSYLYHIVPAAQAQKIASCSRSLQLLASVVSSALGGVLAQVWPLEALFAVSTLSMGAVFATVLYFPDTAHTDRSAAGLRASAAVVREAVASWRVCKWLLYSMLTTCVHQLALTYIQTLFEEAGGDPFWNGFVYSLAYLLGGISALVPAAVPRHLLDWLAEVLIVAVTLANGVFLAIMGATEEPVLVYGLFFVYHCLFELMVPVASALVARRLGSTKYALLFTTNAALSLVLQSVLQFLVGKQVLDLSIGAEFVAFGAWLLLAGLLLGVGQLWAAGLLFRRRCSLPNERSPVVPDQASLQV